MYTTISLSWFNAMKYLQIMILFVIPKHLGTSGENYAKNLLRAVVLAQYIPRLCRFLPMLIYPTGFIFESAWASFFINLFTFMLSGHVVGSWWYLFGLQVMLGFYNFFFQQLSFEFNDNTPTEKFYRCIQSHLIMISLLYYFRTHLQHNSSVLSQRVNQCLRNACKHIYFDECSKLIDCGHGSTQEYQKGSNWPDWKKNDNASACFTEDGFKYGIYLKAVNLTTKSNVLTRYVYSSFWGFQVSL